MKANRSVVVTGATGFIGSNLTRRLLKEGFDVHIIVRRSSNLITLNDVIENIRIHVHNGTTSRMISIIRAIQPSCVFHLASYFLADHTKNDITSLITSNILFGTQLLEAMKTCGVKNIINSSTSWQYYNSSNFNPVCLYAATKQAFEDLLFYYVEVEDFRVISIQLYDTYGPNDPRNKIFKILKAAANSNIPISMTPGDQLLDLVYIDDIIDGYLQAFDILSNRRESLLKKYSLATRNPISLRDLANLYGQVLGKKPNILWGGRQYRRREIFLPTYNIENLPGWQPKVELKTGIELLRGINDR